MCLKLHSFQMIKREIWNVLWYAVVKMSNIDITLLNTRCLTHYHRQMTHLGAFNSCSCSHPISKLKFLFSSLNKSNIARMTFWNSWETFKKGNVTLTLSPTLGFRRAHASYVDGLFAPSSVRPSNVAQMLDQTLTIISQVEGTFKC